MKEVEEGIAKAKELLLKMPSNFQDLISLKSIAAQAQVVHILSSNAKEFYKLYFDSHIMNKKQVLSYISEADQKIYDLSELNDDPVSTYMVDVKNKKVLKLRGSSRSSGNQTVDYSQREYFGENYESLIIRRDFARYSPTYRGGDNGILDKWYELWSFDSKTNTFIGKEEVKLKHSSTYGWYE
jgi:hypothetical protein